MMSNRPFSKQTPRDLDAGFLKRLDRALDLSCPKRLNTLGHFGKNSARYPFYVIKTKNDARRRTKSNATLAADGVIPFFHYILSLRFDTQIGNVVTTNRLPPGLTGPARSNSRI
jgi:hypothetical protein